MDDSAMYTGVDGVTDGVFGNEKLEDTTKELLDEQKRQMAELTPKLQDIVTMLQAEQDIMTDFIATYADDSKDDNDVYRATMMSAGRYRKYIGELKTKFALALNEVKK